MADEDRVEALEARVAVLERAVADLTAHLPKAPAGEKRTLYGIEVRLRPGVTDRQVRAAIPDEKLGADEIVDLLEADGLLARTQVRRR